MTPINALRDFHIELNDDGKNSTFTVIHYTGKSQKIIVPADFAGMPITAIGGAAFSDCKEITGVIISETITTIDEGAFDGCSSLTEITVSEQNSTFASSEGVLYDKDMITLIRYPEGKKGDYAIPDTVVAVEPSAFHHCKNLTSLSLPQDTIVFDFDTFCGCDQLTDIIVHEDNPVYSSIDGVLFNKDGTILLRYPPGKENTDYVIPEKTVRIGYTAFWDCEWLTNIVLPKSLKFIGESIIENCVRLKTIKLSRETMMLNWILDRLSRQLVYLD